MTEEQRRRGPAATQVDAVGHHVRRNVTRLRKTRGWTTYQLASKLAEVGRPIPQSGVSRIESGSRRVDVDDLAALALVLNTSPITLLLPPDWGDKPVQLTSRVTHNARTAWRWARGLGPASDYATGDITATPDDKVSEAAERAAYRDFRKLEEEYHDVTLPPELRLLRQHPAGRDTESIRRQVDRLILMSGTADDDAFADRLEQAKAAVSRMNAELDRIAEDRALRKRQGG